MFHELDHYSKNLPRSVRLALKINQQTSDELSRDTVDPTPEQTRRLKMTQDVILKFLENTPKSQYSNY